MGDDVKHMQMVAGVMHAADGLAVDYGPGELHEPGSLPAGVPYRDVLATPEQLATAPAYARPAPEPEPKPAAAEQKTPASKAPGKA